MTNNACGCGKPTDAYVCQTCAGALEKALGDCTWLDDELMTTITRQKGASTEGGARGTNTSLPFHETASNARRELHTTLTKWVRYCSRNQVRGTPRWETRDTIPSRSRWLLNCVHGLTLNEAGGEAVQELTDAVSEAERIVFWKRRSRQYLGPCAQTVLDEYDEIIHEVCPGDVYADEGAPVGECDLCGQGVTVAIRKGELTKELDDRLYTAAEIAWLATFLGLQQDRDRVRKQVNSWHSRKLIQPAGKDAQEDPMFRYGDIRALLYSTYDTTRRLDVS